MGVELLAVIGDDAGRFLAAMLQGVQPERRQRGRVGMAENAEDAAFLVQMVIVEGMVVSIGLGSVMALQEPHAEGRERTGETPGF